MNGKISVTERRFREGLGQRYMADGITTRCQAVAKEKLRAIQEREGNPDLTPEDVWPEAQCERKAVVGKLLCGGRGGHGGGSELVPEYDMLSFMPVDLAEKMRVIMDNPNLLSRRFELAQLVARTLVLYERLQTNEAAGGLTLEIIREGLDDIEDGNYKLGTDKIRRALESRMIERETYGEIFATMSLLKDMTRTEMSSIKDLKQIITLEQMMAFVTGQADSLKEALERYIPDEHTRQLIAGYVAESTTKRLNSRSGAILESSDIIEGGATATE